MQSGWARARLDPKSKETVELIHKQKVRLSNSLTEHEIARDEIATLYYMLMIPSIVLSAFLSVINVVMAGFDSQLVSSISAVLNAVNGILLATSGLMKYQSKMEAHANAVRSCTALLSECHELDVSFDCLRRGKQAELDEVQNILDEFLVSLPARITNIADRHKEIEQLCPPSNRWARQARKRLMDFRNEEIDWIQNLTDHANSDMRAAEFGRSRRSPR